MSKSTISTFQLSFGFRPNGPNVRDEQKHGIYSKDLNGDCLELLTPEMVKDIGITLECSRLIYIAKSAL